MAGASATSTCPLEALQATQVVFKPSCPLSRHSQERDEGRYALPQPGPAAPLPRHRQTQHTRPPPRAPTLAAPPFNALVPKPVSLRLWKESGPRWPRPLDREGPQSAETEGTGVPPTIVITAPPHGGRADPAARASHPRPHITVLQTSPLPAGTPAPGSRA